jgi:hypothetical protein
MNKSNNIVNSLSKLFFLVIFLASGLNHHSKCQVVNSGMVLCDERITLSKVKDKHELFVSVPEHKQDLSPYQGIHALISNPGDTPCRVEGHLNEERWINSCIYLLPGEQKILEIVFRRTDQHGTDGFPAMNGLPGGTLWHFLPVDPSNIHKVTFTIYAENTCSVTISDIKTYGDYISPAKIASRPDLYPFIDKYGQYKYDEWPGKIHKDSDLKTAALREHISLNNLPGPSGRDQFGGWANGPKLKATGSFRTEKYNGKWWLITPEGNLFWSNGITCVRFSNAVTRIEGRKHFFEGLPDITGDFSICYTGSNFNFTIANLIRKYGEEWKTAATEMTLRRIKSWGLNSFGNWSDPEIYLTTENRIPYTVSISSRSPRIDGKSHKFPDVFDPSFRQTLAEDMAELSTRTKDDPFCIGYFVDNELDLNNLTQALLNQPANGYAKTAFINFLKEKYKSVQQLNKAWNSTYKNWMELAMTTQAPEPLPDDFRIFDKQIIDLYYKTCREEVKRVTPDKLYLGSRLHYHYYHDDPYDIVRTTSAPVIRIAAKYCDVISFNRYNFSVNDLILPENIDKPVLIGEFHFGALDCGFLHPGIRSVANQKQRAEAYSNFIEGALNNGQIVGAHWFQYGDQAVTGRFDGENYQIGFLDLCDNPYPEMIKASRQIGYRMYDIRSNNKEKTKDLSCND